jgi:hypothetical protein
MTFADVSEIICSILDICAPLVARNRDSIRNERYFHHMFSFLAAQKLGGVAAWNEMKLNPEHPTTIKFRFRGRLSVYDVEKTAADAVGSGVPGRIDFAIQGSPRVVIEWKGPGIYSEREILEVLLKLLTEPEQDIKIFAAIFTSSEIDRADHRKTIVERFNKYLEFTKGVLQLKSLTADLSRLNLYACMATIPNTGPQKIHWGQVTGNLRVT